MKHGLSLLSAVLTSLVLGIGIAPISGCLTKSEKPKLPAKPDARYTVKGIIEVLPAPGPPKQDLSVHHEAIPDFVNSQGKAVGMSEMIMEFPEIAKGVSLKDLKVGDEIEMTFEVYWKHKEGEPAVRWVVTRIAKLAPGAHPNLAKAKDSDAAGETVKPKPASGKPGTGN